MLIEDFYKIISVNKKNGETVLVETILNPGHQLYSGHFPEKAVVPGVIQMQMVRELAEYVSEKKYKIRTIHFIKYLIPIIPEGSFSLQVTLKMVPAQEGVICHAVISSPSGTHSKMKLLLTGYTKPLSK